MNNLQPSQIETPVETPVQPPIQLQNPSSSAVPPQPQQAPAENPLDQLRDIHLPDQIDQFPYAPGWWILLALLLIGIAFFLFHIYKKRRAIRLLKPARAEINQLRSLSQEQLSAHSVAKLSALLKRVCLIYFPRSSVASLNGYDWLNFLNDQAAYALTKHAPQKNSSHGRQFFSDADIQLFSRAAYQANPEIEMTDWLRLLSSSENCIEAIIRTAAKKRLVIPQMGGSQLQYQSGGRL